MSSLKKFLVTLIFGLLCSSTESHQTIERNNQTQIQIISREEWKAEPALKELTKLLLPVSNVIIGHTVTSECESKENCEEKLRAIQKYHMENNHFDDIGYNFLISNNGEIYEGRGWNMQGAHTKYYNSDSMGIALIGNYEIVEPTNEQLLAMEKLIEYGVSLRNIVKNYRLYGQRQLRPTTSPGKFVFDILRTMPHWTEKIN